MGLFARNKSSDIAKHGKSATGALSPSDSLASLRSTLSDTSTGGGESHRESGRWQKMSLPAVPRAEHSADDFQSEHWTQRERVVSLEARQPKGSWTKRKETPRPRTMDRLLMGGRSEVSQHLQVACSSNSSRQIDRSMSFNALSHDGVPRQVLSPPQRSTASLIKPFSSSLAPTPEVRTGDMPELFDCSRSLGRSKTVEKRRTFSSAASATAGEAEGDEDYSDALPAMPVTPTSSKSGQALRQAGNRLRSGFRRTPERPKTADDSRVRQVPRDLAPLSSTSDSFPRRRKTSGTSLRTAVSMNVLTNGQSVASAPVQAAGSSAGSTEAMANALKTLAALHRRQASISPASDTHSAGPSRPRAFTLESPKGRRTASESSHTGARTISDKVPQVPARPKTASHLGVTSATSFRLARQEERWSGTSLAEGGCGSSSDGTEDAGTYGARRSGESSKDGFTVRSTSDSDPLCLDLFLQLGPRPLGLPEDDLVSRTALVISHVESAALTRTQRHEKAAVDDDDSSPIRVDFDYAMRRLEADLSAWLRARIIDDREALQACTLAKVFTEARRELDLLPSSWRLHKLFDFSTEYESAKTPTGASTRIGEQQGWNTQYSLAMDAMAGLAAERKTSAGKAPPSHLLMPVPRSRRRPATSGGVSSSSLAGAWSPRMSHRMHVSSVGGLAPWQEDMGMSSVEHDGGLGITDAKTTRQCEALSGFEAFEERQSHCWSEGHDATPRFSPVESASPTSLAPTTPPMTLSESVLQRYQNAARMTLCDGDYDDQVRVKDHDDYSTHAFQPLSAESFHTPARVFVPHAAVEAVKQLTSPVSDASPMRLRSQSAATTSSMQTDSFHSATSSPPRGRSPE